jgi:two-component SAPR family response regulator
VDEPENKHYIEKFEIFSNAVVIVEKKGGSVSRYKAVESIWDVSEDKDAISHLLQTEVAGFLPES